MQYTNTELMSRESRIHPKYLTKITSETQLNLSTVVKHATTWARQAGRIALHYLDNAGVMYKSDNTLLTKADIEIEAFLMNQIRNIYPDHSLLGEEGIRNKMQSYSPYTWVIDPLDGTTSFVLGLPGWGISLGLLYEGEPIFGLFYMPLLDDLTCTTPEGLFCTKHVLHGRVQPQWGRKSFLAVNAGAHHDFNIDVIRTRALGSVSASLIYTARSVAAAAFIPKAYAWDLVAGASILAQSGGELRYLSGEKINFRDLLDRSLAPEPIIAGHPTLLDQLQCAIQPRQEQNHL